MRVRWSAAAAAIVAVVLAAPASSTGAAPSLRAQAAACAAEGRSSYAAILDTMRRGDPLALQRAARRLAARAEACARTLHATRAAGRAACGRTVVVRGARFYRDGGRIMDAAVTAGLRGGGTDAFSASILRGAAFMRAADSELAVGVEVLAGKRGCAKGVAAARPLRPATLRLLPGLAREVAAIMLQAQGSLLPEDRVAFGLLTVQLDTGTPPPAAAVEAQIVNLTNKNRGMQAWRLAGLRTFWVKHATEVDWRRYPFTAARFLQAYRTYLTWKVTALQNQRNQFLGGIVGSEEAWQRAVAGWRAWETRWYTREQASVAAYDAWERSFKAERALLEAEAALKRTP
ncbi:MAG TPA: hypothetical protein VFY02_14445 [Gaiellaceae bacterium]|nr:hypothetical protein [Gaiellaceae bacterium]